MQESELALPTAGLVRVRGDVSPENDAIMLLISMWRPVAFVIPYLGSTLLGIRLPRVTVGPKERGLTKFSREPLVSVTRLRGPFLGLFVGEASLSMMDDRAAPGHAQRPLAGVRTCRRRVAVGEQEATSSHNRSSSA